MNRHDFFNFPNTEQTDFSWVRRISSLTSYLGIAPLDIQHRTGRRSLSLYLGIIYSLGIIAFIVTNLSELLAFTNYLTPAFKFMYFLDIPSTVFFMFYTLLNQNFLRYKNCRKFINLMGKLEKQASTWKTFSKGTPINTYFQLILLATSFSMILVFDTYFNITTWSRPSFIVDIIFILSYIYIIGTCALFVVTMRWLSRRYSMLHQRTTAIADLEPKKALKELESILDHYKLAYDLYKQWKIIFRGVVFTIVFVLIMNVLLLICDLVTDAAIGATIYILVNFVSTYQNI